MIELSLKLVDHGGEKRIGIVVAFDKILNAQIRKLPGLKWSKTNNCWTVPLTDWHYRLIFHHLRPHCIINTKAVHEHFAGTSAYLPPRTPKNRAKKHKPLNLSEVNKNALDRYIQELQLKSYSKSTIKTYRNEFVQLLGIIGTRDIDSLSVDDLRRYFQHIIEKEKLKENTVHSRLNAVKFYFEQVLGRDRFLYELPRPVKPLMLPKVLSEQELGRLFNALENKKHKAMLFTIYSAGLRVSELVNLRLRDIDSGRMQIFIGKAKGKKDRYVNLSPVLLDILRQYWTISGERPKEYLFESSQTGRAYPVRTVQQIFSNAKRKAGIAKEVGIHSLRHSFATHLLEKGIDMRFIKDFLGHFDIRTTERYLHVARSQLVNIVSPLDHLLRDGNVKF